MNSAVSDRKKTTTSLPIENETKIDKIPKEITQRKCILVDRHAAIFPSAQSVQPSVFPLVERELRYDVPLTQCDEHGRRTYARVAAHAHQRGSILVVRRDCRVRGGMETAA